jgi:hypothetical protein
MISWSSCCRAIFLLPSASRADGRHDRALLVSLRYSGAGVEFRRDRVVLAPAVAVGWSGVLYSWGEPIWPFLYVHLLNGVIKIVPRTSVVVKDGVRHKSAVAPHDGARVERLVADTSGGGSVLATYFRGPFLPRPAAPHPVAFAALTRQGAQQRRSRAHRA